MKREKIKTLEEIVEKKDSNKIYKMLGKNIYLEIKKYIQTQKDIKKLLSDGRFYEIYERYGEFKYSRKLDKMMKVDIRNELGIKPGIINFAFFDKLKRGVKKAILIPTLSVSIFSSMMITISTISNKEREIAYSEILNEYNNEIEAYAKYINSLGLSDLEIIIKVMNDMWSNIDGYKDPKSYDTLGFNRLSLYNDGYGVCRGMADDFSARMNAINPDYEACNLIVYSSGLDEEVINKIGAKRVNLNEVNVSNEIINETIEHQNPTQTENIGTLEETSNNQEVINNEILVEVYEEKERDLVDEAKLIGNHMVSCIKLKEEGIILIVDPTNTSIGVLKDGNIIMLSNCSEPFEITAFSTLILDIEWHLNFQQKLLDSFRLKENLSEINKKYGVNAQNEVLDDIIEKYDEKQYKIRGR